jgi:hypothetical protein
MLAAMALLVLVKKPDMVGELMAAIRGEAVRG